MKKATGAGLLAFLVLSFLQAGILRAQIIPPLILPTAFLQEIQAQQSNSDSSKISIGELNLFPVPVNGTAARLIFTLSEHADVAIHIYDLNNQEVTMALYVSFAGGIADQTLSLPENLGNGIYFCRVEARGIAKTVKFEVNRF
jgi:hypothetical protein